MFSLNSFKSLKKGIQFTINLRSLSTQWNYSKLEDRSIIQVQGDEAPAFLQGLMTNDIYKLAEGERKSLYCMFLNNGGRILYDAIISKGLLENQFLLDVDSRASNLARKHLSMYKVRRKINIGMEDLSVYALFKESIEYDMKLENPSKRESIIGSTYCDGGLGIEDTSLPIELTCLNYPDPRLASLGHRLLLKDSDSLTCNIPNSCNMVDMSSYVYRRCILGISEGVEDMPVGKCIPLEYNLDYLHGVSFHKGCYIGQELTARTHHTGVIRKRVLPLQFSGEIVKGEGEDFVVVKNDAGKTVGKVIRSNNGVGMGLMRLQESFAAQSLKANEATITVFKPKWWPQDKSNPETAKSNQ